VSWRGKSGSELVRETAGKLAPGGDALGLDEPLALAGELGCHVVETARKRANLVAPSFRHARLPIAAGYLLGGGSQPLDGPETRAAIQRLHRMAKRIPAAATP